MELRRIKSTEGFLECNLFLCIPHAAAIWLRINGNPAWKKEGGWMDGWMGWLVGWLVLAKKAKKEIEKYGKDMARTFFTFSFNPL